MKIAMIGHKRIPSRAGGVEVVVGELAERTAKRGVDVFAYNRNCGEKKINQYNGVNIVEIPTPKKSALNASVYSILATVHACFKKFNLIHFHAEGPCAALPLAKLFGKKTVATIHGLDWQRAKWGGFAKRYLLFGERMAAKYADSVIVLSKSMQEYFKNRYNRETILVPNGVNKPNFLLPNVISERFNLKKDEYILFLARITPEKGLDILLDAYKKLNTDKALIIAGATEPETEYIKHIKEVCKENDKIHLFGFAGSDEVAELFTNCCFYVLPSDVEGMPISLLEALSYKAKIVASDIPENAEVLKGYGSLFKAGDSESLYNAMKKMLENPDYYGDIFDADTSWQAVEKFLDSLISEHDWDSIVERNIEIYKQVLNMP